MATLVVIYFLCLLMAETLHHNAAVAIMFPIALASAQRRERRSEVGHGKIGRDHDGADAEARIPEDRDRLAEDHS